LEAIEAFGARVVLYGQPEYPHLLHFIADPPPVLIVRGFTHIWDNRDAIAIVGARNASANGCLFAYKLADELSTQNALVVSGLARGIDASAHKGSLAAGTAAVIAGGIDTIYPPENKDLFAKIAENGAIISEQPFGAIPHPRSFPGRNRIISGMSLGVAVIEASAKSGSLITAHFALDQNREVFAVPGSPLDPRCKGSNDLLRQGATVTESAEDILRVIRQLRQKPLRESELPLFAAAAAKPVSESELKEARTVILAKLGPEPVAADDLITLCEFTAPVVIAVLLELELAGKLNRYPGNRVSLNYSELTSEDKVA